jgi:hypothetical protein
MRNEPFNRQLISDLSTLAASALTQLRDEQRLVRETLTALPIPADDIPEAWSIFAESIWQTLREQEVLPTAAGGYAGPESLWQGTQDLRAVLEDKDLSAVAAKEMSWAVSAGGERRLEAIEPFLCPWPFLETVIVELIKDLLSVVEFFCGAKQRRCCRIGFSYRI